MNLKEKRLYKYMFFYFRVPERTVISQWSYDWRGVLRCKNTDKLTLSKKGTAIKCQRGCEKRLEDAWENAQLAQGRCSGRDLVVLSL